MMTLGYPVGRPPEIGEPMIVATGRRFFREGVAPCPYCCAPMEEGWTEAGDGAGRVVELRADGTFLVDAVPAGTPLYRCDQCRQMFVGGGECQ